jgi:uridine kinase
MCTVIAIAGTTGAGKTTLVNKLASELNGVALFFDAYQKTTYYPNDLISRLSEGESIDTNLNPIDVKSPDFYADLCKLKEGKKIIDPWGRELNPAKYIIVEEPFARLREDMKEILDSVVYIQIPYHISLARRVLRDIRQKSINQDFDSDKKLEEIENYLSSYINGLAYGYQMIDQLAIKSSDLVLDGLKETDKNVLEVIDFIKNRHGI